MAEETTPETISPRLHPEPVVYAIVRPEFEPSGALGTVLEPEGLTVVVEQRDADEDGLLYDFVGAWITLSVLAGLDTGLDAVGVTARLSRVLADAGIACNVLAGFHHVHLVVPWDRRHDALALLAPLG